MKPGDQRKPNVLLRHQRLVRGWSLQRVVDEICALSQPEGRIPGVSAAMVSCWEMGKKKPSPFYQERLCLIYGLTADQLGFMDAPVLPLPKLLSEIVRPFPVSDTLQHASLTQTAASVAKVMPIPFTGVVPRQQIQAIDLLTGETQHTPDEQLGAWLTLGANHLSMLLDAGWSPDNVLDSVRVVLQGVQGLPAVSRRKLVQLSGVASISGITLPTGSHVLEEERLRFTGELGNSIAAAFGCFHKGGSAQVLAIAQACLSITEQSRDILNPVTHAIFRSSIYSLLGLTLHLQEHYQQALYSHISANIAAQESGDSWRLIQSLISQAGAFQSLGKHAEAIQLLEASLSLIGDRVEEKYVRAKAHLLACWADSATAIGEYAMAQEKLSLSSTFVNLVPPNEEFDEASWLQIAGKCALMTNDYDSAIMRCETALVKLPQNAIFRQAITLIPLAIAYARKRERDKTLEIA
ncbi:MAG TPA: hypothetical protein VFQ36_13860, partial [Ktedonobacteraceae bacterium]|nr:hypothetical protein [Ktedonobacteraceae bacterium]